MVVKAKPPRWPRPPLLAVSMRCRLTMTEALAFAGGPMDSISLSPISRRRRIKVEATVHTVVRGSSEFFPGKCYLIYLLTMCLAFILAFGHSNNYLSGNKCIIIVDKLRPLQTWRLISFLLSLIVLIRDGTLFSSSEYVPGLEQALHWRPSGKYCLDG